MATPKVFLQYGFIVALLCNLLSCSSSPQKALPRRTQHLVTLAQEAGFSLQRYQTTSFVLTTYERIPQGRSQPIHVYIEGDGNSWKSKYKLSDNPTPHQPLALELALKDPYPAVLYIARPCQYTPLNMDKNCQPKFWSSHRYAPEVIAATNEVLNHVAQQNGQARFLLIGFSGGATIAAFLAAQRPDIIGLLTVAGDLNHEALNQHHHTSPLVGSLNPISIAPQLKHLPQRHYCGEKDRIVPPWVALQFAKKVASPCAQTYLLKGATHHQKWAENWPALLKMPLSCSASSEHT